MLSLEQLYTDNTNNDNHNDDDNDDNDNDTNNNDNDTRQTNYDCIGSLACMPNDPKTQLIQLHLQIKAQREVNIGICVFVLWVSENGFSMFRHTLYDCKYERKCFPLLL